MAEPRAAHEPVLVDRIVELLAVGEPGLLVDATVGAGGHAAALLAASHRDVRLVGFDRDPGALELARRTLEPYGDRVTLVHAGYDDLTAIVRPLIADGREVLAVLYDLGVSSMQLDAPDRGFSFRAGGALDMRMDPTATPTAADLVNALDEQDLGRLIARLGEERYARRIAAAIVRARPLSTTTALAALIDEVVPRRGRTPGLHAATRTFQALRIAVNTELDRFSASLPQALELAAPAASRSSGRGGRVATLSYHSLEDRIAKRSFSDAASGCICPPDLPVCACGRVPLVRHLTKGVERPTDAEISRNPRARAAKLRAVERIAHGPLPAPSPLRH